MTSPIHHDDMHHVSEGWGFIHNNLRDEKYNTDFKSRQLCLLMNLDGDCF